MPVSYFIAKVQYDLMAGHCDPSPINHPEVPESIVIVLPPHTTYSDDCSLNNMGMIFFKILKGLREAVINQPTNQPTNQSINQSKEFSQYYLDEAND